jgi:hypothetical protein
MDTKEVKAFSPQDVLNAKTGVIPAEVIETINQLLAERFDGNPCYIKQDEVVERASSSMKDVSRNDFFDKGWLNFESLYEKQGWRVDYDKPAYNENYSAFWRFEPRTSKD